jgi:broad specificity phosphatase PhoE
VTRLLLLAHGPTPALRRTVFGRDDDLDEGGLRAALALAPAVTARAGAWRCGPSRAAQQTIRALGHEPTVEAALAEPDHGRWAGSTLQDVAAAEAGSVQAWLTDPGAAPHGGESLAALTARVGGWLDTVAGQPMVAVAHPVVVRAALAAALGLPGTAIWQLDVAPLSRTRLEHRAGRWHLRFPPA